MEGENAYYCEKCRESVSLYILNYAAFMSSGLSDCSVHRLVLRALNRMVCFMISICVEFTLLCLACIEAVLFVVCSLYHIRQHYTNCICNLRNAFLLSWPTQCTFFVLTKDRVAYAFVLMESSL